jgi:hypothetical protein
MNLTDKPKPVNPVPPEANDGTTGTSGNVTSTHEGYDLSKAKRRGAKALAAAIIASVGLFTAGLTIGRKSQKDRAPDLPTKQYEDTADTSTTSSAVGDVVSFATDEENEARLAAEAKTDKAKDKAEFISTGYIDTANGAVECFEIKGGYHKEDDPYATKFAHKDEEAYENDDAYGFEIEGDTVAEKTANWIKNVMKSPEAIVRLRVQMGEENLDSLEKENELANKIRGYSADDYDKIANDTANKFYNKLKGGQIIESNYWMLENYMNDGQATDHSDSEVHGRLNQDDEYDEHRDKLLTFYDRNGNNIVSSWQGYMNTAKDANATYLIISQIAWVNMDEGGTWKWKTGTVAQTPEEPPVVPPVVPPEVPPEEPPAESEPDPTPPEPDDPTPPEPDDPTPPEPDDPEPPEPDDPEPPEPEKPDPKNEDEEEKHADDDDDPADNVDPDPLPEDDPTPPPDPDLPIDEPTDKPDIDPDADF